MMPEKFLGTGGLWRGRAKKGHGCPWKHDHIGSYATWHNNNPPEWFTAWQGWYMQGSLPSPLAVRPCLGNLVADSRTTSTRYQPQIFALISLHHQLQTQHLLMAFNTPDSPKECNPIMLKLVYKTCLVVSCRSCTKNIKHTKCYVLMKQLVPYALFWKVSNLCMSQRKCMFYIGTSYFLTQRHFQDHCLVLEESCLIRRFNSYCTLVLLLDGCSVLALWAGISGGRKEIWRDQLVVEVSWDMVFGYNNVQKIWHLHKTTYPSVRL